jgi:hypothetical protein
VSILEIPLSPGARTISSLIRVSDANGVLHVEIATNHLVSEPSLHACKAWLLIVYKRVPAIHPI